MLIYVLYIQIFVISLLIMLVCCMYLACGEEFMAFGVIFIIRHSYIDIIVFKKNNIILKQHVFN